MDLAVIILDLSVIFLLLGEIWGILELIEIDIVIKSTREVIDNIQNDLSLTPICETEMEELIHS